MIATRQATLAKNVYALVEARAKEEYREAYSRLAVELGFIIRNNGLSATLAYLSGEKAAGLALLSDLYALADAPWADLPEIGDAGAFVLGIGNLGEIEYLAATRFALMAAEWFKRFAEGPISGHGAVGANASLRSEAAENPRASRFSSASADSCNAGQVLDFGYVGPASRTAELLEKVAGISVSDEYKEAYRRWLRFAAAKGFTMGQAKLRNRAFLGSGYADVKETHVLLHPVFGAPYVPGETMKGLTRAYAESAGEMKVSNDQIKWMFGAEPNPSVRNSGNIGNLQFHDAWWNPELGGQPLVLEADTPHHQDYYGKEGKSAATDWDDPNPVSHLAVSGTFLLAISGESLAASLALRLAAEALGRSGVGSRRSSGYGVVATVTGV